MSEEWKDGLPPVGFTDKDCELVGVVGFDFGFEVVAHRGISAIIWGRCENDEEGEAETMLACHFRPIRTKEQREQREELLEVIRKVDDGTGEFSPFNVADAVLAWLKERPQ